MRLSRYLPKLPVVVTLCAICQFGVSSSVVAQSGEASIKLESPNRVSDPGIFKKQGTDETLFDDAYVLVSETADAGFQADYWILKGSRELVFDDDITISRDGEQPDEDEDEEYIVFSTYEGYNSGNEQRSEKGYFGLQLKHGEQRRLSGSAIGFIRPPASTNLPSDVPTDAPQGIFSSLAGTLSWDFKTSNDRSIQIEWKKPSNSTGTPDYTSTTQLNSNSAEAISLDGWYIYGSKDTGDTTRTRWNFSSSSLSKINDSDYLGIIGRIDDESPDSFQDLMYFVRVIDTNDSDNDGVPDIADTAESVADQPVWLERSLGGGWFVANWMSRTEPIAGHSDYDYAVFHASPRFNGGWVFSYPRYGWVYVDVSAEKSNFWSYFPSIGWNDSLKWEWMWTNEIYYPYFYRYRDGAWLYYLLVTDNNYSHFYNHSAAKWEYYPSN